MKRHIYLLIVLLIQSCPVNAQWQWVHKIGGSQLDRGTALINKDGSLYCYGDFKGVCFMGYDTLFDSGSNDMFVARYDSQGNEIWSLGFGGINGMNTEEYIGGVALDTVNDYLYLNGTFYGTLTIDTFSLSSNGSLDLFLAKFDLSGNCIWLIKASSSFDDNPLSINLDQSGNIYWTGDLKSNGYVDTVSIGTGVFLAKVSPGGDILWTREFIRGGDITNSLISENNIYVLTWAKNDTTWIDTAYTFSPYSYPMDFILSKHDLSGNVQWAKRYINSGVAYGRDICINSSKELFIVGTFHDSISLDGNLLVQPGKDDLFLAKLDSSGNVIWVKQSYANGLSGTQGLALDQDEDGNLYIGGNFSGSAQFGSISVSANSSRDLFIAKYDTSGACLGVRQATNGSINNLQVNHNNEIVGSGTFTNTMTAGSFSITSYGDKDIFIFTCDGFSGLGEQKNTGNTLFIYANPNAGKCTVVVPDGLINERYLELRIFDSKGKLMQEQKLEMHDGTVKVNLEAQAKGVYHVTLGNNQKQYSGKIVFD
jgi:hypothetical protein